MDQTPEGGTKSLISQAITFVAVVLVIAVIGVGAYRSLGYLSRGDKATPTPEAQDWRALGLVPLDTTISDVSEKVLPSVVTITTTKPVSGVEQPLILLLPPSVPRDRQGLGSGVVVREDGYIATNHHVVSRASDIRVKLYSGEELPAQVIGSDPAVDLALLKIDKRGLEPVEFGNSDRVRIGEVVLAVGNPLGIGQTVTMGIISAKNRSLGLSAYENFLQTDAAINPGNSGGALVNLEGKLVGLSTAISSSDGGYQGISFAIPSNLADETIRALISGQRPQRGWIGVSMQNLSPQLARYFNLDNTNGVLIIEVYPGQPGDLAGFREQDVILSYNGQNVTDMAQLRNKIGLSKPGEAQTFTVWRNGVKIDIEVTLGIRPD